MNIIYCPNCNKLLFKHSKDVLHLCYIDKCTCGTSIIILNNCDRMPNRVNNNICDCGEKLFKGYVVGGVIHIRCRKCGLSYIL